MQIEQLKSIKPNSDPLEADSYRMYKRIGTNLDIYLMNEAYSDDIAEYLIVTSSAT